MKIQLTTLIPTTLLTHASSLTPQDLPKRGTISGKLLGRAPPAIEDDSDDEDEEESMIDLLPADYGDGAPSSASGYVPPQLPQVSEKPLPDASA